MNEFIHVYTRITTAQIKMQNIPDSTGAATSLSRQYPVYLNERLQSACWDLLRPRKTT